MKLFLKLALAFSVLAWLANNAWQHAQPTFLLDMLTLHGQTITATPVAAESATPDWRNYTLTFNNVSIDNPATESDKSSSPFKAINIETLGIVLSPESRPDFKKSRLLPQILAIELLTLDRITIDYDVDTDEGHPRNLDKLQQNINTAAAEYLRQRLNASNNGALIMPQRASITTLKLSGININTRSNESPEKRKNFSIQDMQFSEMGKNSEGLTSAEIIDIAMRNLMDEIRQEARKQKIIDPPRPVAVENNADSNTATARKRTARKTVDTDAENTEEQEPPAKEGKVKQAAKTVGSGFKKIGSGIKGLFSK